MPRRLNRQQPDHARAHHHGRIAQRRGVRATACTATETASIIAACSNAAQRKPVQIRRGTATNSANAPMRR